MLVMTFQGDHANHVEVFLNNEGDEEERIDEIKSINIIASETEGSPESVCLPLTPLAAYSLYKQLKEQFGIPSSPYFE